MKLKARYELAKAANVGEQCICPSCKAPFIKDNYQQAFCKNNPGTQCKDYYWNNVTPNKRNNTTRISPANAAYMAKQRAERRYDRDIDDETHPHDSEALGQWDD